MRVAGDLLRQDNDLDDHGLNLVYGREKSIGNDSAE